MDKYTGILRGVIFGLGEDKYMWGADAPAGLGIPVPEYVDSGQPRDGTFGGVDRVTKRIIRIPITIVASEEVVDEELLTPAESAERALDALRTAWRPSSDVTTLDLRLAGPERRFYGRARGLDVDVSQIDQGVIFCDGSFEALEWLAYDLEAVDFVTPDTVSPITFVNEGNAATSRCIIRVAGDGGKPLIINNNDRYRGFIRFRKPLLSGQSVDINLNDYRIIDSSNNTPRDNLISPMSTFFVVEPGNNTVSFTNCASITYRIRSAYF